MGLPGPEHFLFIPGMLMIGFVAGYVYGSRAAQAEAARRAKKRMK